MWAGSGANKNNRKNIRRCVNGGMFEVVAQVRPNQMQYSRRASRTVFRSPEGKLNYPGYGAPLGRVYEFSFERKIGLAKVFFRGF